MASTIGTAIEWYDFFLYATTAGLVFAKVFFPKSDPLVGTLEAFGVNAVGFVARPIGAAIFGHYGDRIGRKATLIATLLLMGVATLLVAVVPSYASVGAWGAALLVFLRFVQGVGVGGEWGGSILLSMEWSRSSRSHGFIASLPQLGVPVGLLLANAVVLVCSKLTGDQFLTWGWRVPFSLSLLLVAIGLYIRIGILETPVFRQVVAEKQVVRQPIVEVIRRHPREIILAALVRMAEQAPGYIFITFIYAYGTNTLGVSRDFLLASVVGAQTVSFVAIPFAGHLSDRVGRRKVYVVGAALMGIFGFAYFWLLNTRSLPLIFLAIVLANIPWALLYGPLAALTAELFPGRVRYSGASLGYQLASVIAGGPAPLIATWLLARTHSSTPIAFYILACSVISITATAMLKDVTA